MKNEFKKYIFALTLLSKCYILLYLLYFQMEIKETAQDRTADLILLD